MKLIAIAGLLLALCVNAAFGADTHGTKSEHAGGVWYDLSFGRLYVPEHMKAVDGKIDLLVHFHGAPSYMIETIEEKGINVSVLAVSLNGLSSVYTRPFEKEKDLFERMLLEALMCIHEIDRYPEDLKLGKIGVSSFSAGFGAVREILKDNRYFDQINALLMADSLYAGYVKVDGKNKPVPKQMRDFKRFAKQAAAEKKLMLITHSNVVPGSYAGTQETADDLMDAVGVRRKEIKRALAENFEQSSGASKGKFEVIGCDGGDEEAHMVHLRKIGVFVEMMGFGRVDVERE
ncbi:hypothetical protein JD969_12540 [Planctomycetota bacterium]|nr:hypothetical protein JD969_12540 [Planctomycetota bacterium]